MRFMSESVRSFVRMRVSAYARGMFSQGMKRVGAGDEIGWGENEVRRDVLI